MILKDSVMGMSICLSDSLKKRERRRISDHGALTILFGRFCLTVLTITDMVPLL